MPFYRGSPFTRVLNAWILISLLALSFPQPAAAAPLQAVTVEFTILSVKMDESVTIRTVNFPVRTNFTVIMGKATNKASDGVVSADFNSEKGGVLELTFPIPTALKGTGIIGLRIESKDGYQGYNWFFNRNQAAAAIPDSGLKPELAFSGVLKNTTVEVEATNLPPNTIFSVRVGPYYTFYRDYAAAQSVTSDAKGMVSFKIPLGKNVKDAEFIAVRMDGASQYVFASFRNADGGTKASQAELVRIIPCTLLYINPIPALDPREDFDVVWTVQNTGLEDWNSRRFMLKYRSGAEMHKRDSTIFLRYTVERGWTYDFAVDMLAPETPGWHTTTWALVNRFDQNLCEFQVSVFVKP